MLHGITVEKTVKALLQRKKSRINYNKLVKLYERTK